MTTYDQMSAFAQSWMVLMMTVFFVAVIIWVMRPGSKASYDDAANSIFRHEKNPGPQPGSRKEA